MEVPQLPPPGPLTRSPGGVTPCAMASGHCGCGVPLVSVPFLVCGSAQAVGSHPS